MTQSECEGPARVLILDVWSDLNRGDAAMQVGMLKLVRKKCPRAEITVMMAFGANEFRRAIAGLDETAELADNVVGGFRPTFLTRAAHTKVTRLMRKVQGLFALLLQIPLLLLLWSACRYPRLRFLIRGELGRSLEALTEADLVVWNGRNFRSDTRRRELLEFWNLTFNPIVATSAKKSMVCLGVSFWPVKGRPARRLIRYVYRRVQFVSVREEGSLIEVKRTLDQRHTQIALLPDLSLGMYSGDRKGTARVSECELGPRRLGVTLVDWPHHGRKARDQYEKALEVFLSRFLDVPSTRVFIVPQVTYGDESTDAMAARLADAVTSTRLEIIDRQLKSEELMKVYEDLDLLIATRMHSAIFALMAGTIVIPIPYDQGGKWGILSMLGLPDHHIPYDELTCERLATVVDSVWCKRESIMQEVNRGVEACSRQVDLHMDLALAATKHRLFDNG